MKKLSIILSMLVTVTIAAFATLQVASGLNSRAQLSQGYWFTLSRTMDGSQNPTAGAQGEIRYITLGGAAVDPYVPSTQTGTLANKFFWHAEPSTREEGGVYLVNNTTGRYLSAQIFRTETGSETKWGYELTYVASASAAATWQVPTENGNNKEIKVIYAPVKNNATVPEGTEITPNVYLAMSDKLLGQLWLVDAAGNAIETIEDSEGQALTFQKEWTITTAESYYDDALTEGEDKIKTLTDISTLWDNTTAIDAANKAIDDLRGKYDFASGTNSNIVGVIDNVTTKLNAAYNQLYASINAQVITLTAAGAGNLQVENNEINNNGNPDINAFWTIAKSGNGYTFKNDYLNQYLAFIPRKEPVYEWGIEIEPAVPAHFGVANTASVFALTPKDGGIVLSYQDYTFGTGSVDENTETVYNIAAVTPQDAADAVTNGSNFNNEKDAAKGFLDNLSALAQSSGWISVDVWSEDNIFAHYAALIDRFNLSLPDPTKASASEILRSARTQMNNINNLVNKASSPMFLMTGDGKYVSAAFRPYDGYNTSGAEVTYQIPGVLLTDIDATAQGMVLSTALWAFEYAGNGKARFFNSEELYLTAPYFEKQQGQETVATSSQKDATLFVLTPDGRLQYAGETSDEDFSIDNNSTFTIGNAMAKPVASDCYTDNEGVTQPQSNAKYYRIASIGGGGVIGAVLPGDPLTHSATSMGSYWWLEQALDDPEPNAYYIHSVYPSYYLGSDYTLSSKPAKWYIGENSATHTENISKVFNGYESGLLIGTGKVPANSTVIAAAPFTSAGTPNASLQNGRFSTSNWMLTSWMFVEAGDIDNMIADYVSKDLAWQQLAVAVALGEINKDIPFATNSLSAAIAEVENFEFNSTSSITENLKKVIEFNDILNWAQEELDNEVIRNADGKHIKLINVGRQSDMASESYLAGSGSSLKFVSILDDNKNSEWDIKTNGTHGITFRNGEGQSLGSPLANGSLSSSTGTYRLSIDIWWTLFDERGNEVGVLPWYTVPSTVKESAPDAEENDTFNRSLNFGIGLENVYALGTGLAAVSGKTNALCGSELISPYAQWRLVTYKPAPDGIEEIDGDANTAEEVELYNLQGIRVNRADAAPGIYLSRRADGTVVKVVVR